MTEIPERMPVIKKTIINHNQRNFTKKSQLLQRYTLCQLFWWRHITKEPGIHISCSTCDSEQCYCNTYSCDSSNCPCYLRLPCNDTNSWEKSESKVVTFITKQKDLSCNYELFFFVVFLKLYLSCDTKASFANEINGYCQSLYQGKCSYTKGHPIILKVA